MKDRHMPNCAVELKRRYDADPFNLNVTVPSSSKDNDLLRLR
jgi:hypothetical protein